MFQETYGTIFHAWFTVKFVLFGCALLHPQDGDNDLERHQLNFPIEIVNVCVI